MGGGLMQLVAYGAQDIYLTGNPQITFFKVVYRRHTNFSMECIQQTVNGTSTVGSSATSGTVTVSRNGDLLGKCYVRCDQDTANGINGDELITDVTLEIGGQQIDKHTKEWLQVWAELSTPESKASGYKYLTGGFSNTLVTGGETNQQSVMVPLQFYFCRNPGLALPLIALQYHEVKMKFTWGLDTAVGRDGTPATPTCEVWSDYIYLDTEERRRFAQVSHEYLIEQLQYQTEGSAASKYKLNFNHPVKELVWTNATANVTTQKAKITLNGHDRFAQQDREYFQLRQPLDHHTAVPAYNVKETDAPKLLASPLVLTSADGTNANGTGNTPGEMAVAAAGDVNAVNECNLTNATLILGKANDDVAFDVKTGDLLSISVSVIDPDTAGADLGLQSHTVISQVKTLADNALDDTKVTITLTTSTGITTATTHSVHVSVVARTQDPQSRCSGLSNDVNVYSFALKPEEHQPSGTCNFSRIDTAHLEFDASVTVAAVYAVNYNVLRVMSGMGGLAYSN
jgi:hypothetical protein